MASAHTYTYREIAGDRERERERESYSGIQRRIRIDAETKQFKRTACVVIELLVVFWLLCHLYEIKYLCKSAMHTQTQQQRQRKRFVTKFSDWDTDNERRKHYSIVIRIWPTGTV